MQVRLYLDEDAMSEGLLDALLQRGIHVTTVLEQGRVGLPDEAQLEFATEQALTIFTGNVGDYMQLHREWLRDRRSHAGIICLRQQTFSIGEQLRRLLRLIATRSAEDMRDNLEFLSSW